MVEIEKKHHIILAIRAPFEFTEEQAHYGERNIIVLGSWFQMPPL